jgi:hypothetical protein
MLAGDGCSPCEEPTGNVTQFRIGIEVVAGSNIEGADLRWARCKRAAALQRPGLAGYDTRLSVFEPLRLENSIRMLNENHPRRTS